MNLQDYIAALTVWREARGENNQAKIGVAHVLRNRLEDERWPNLIANVCMQPYQFSCHNWKDPNFKKWPKEGAVWEACIDAWIFSDFTVDPTDGANHYHSYTQALDEPNWASAELKTTEIGAFKFYKL